MALSGLAVNACSSDDTGVNDAGGKDSTTPDTGKADTGGGNDTGTNNDTGTTDGGIDCGSIPQLRTSEAGTIFCGYLPDGGPGFNCNLGQQCCLGGSTGGGSFADQKCVGFGAACDNPPPDAGTPIECTQNADCTANGQPSSDVCCLQGAGAPAIVAGCGYYKSQGGKQITCEAADAGACASGEIQVCSQQADCPTGKTCTPMKWKLYQLGFCM